MLRRFLVLASALVFVGTVILLLYGVGGYTSLLVWVAVQGAIVLIALLAERGRYHTRSSGAEPSWQRTAERFQDPSTSQWLVVEYNPTTGERRYVPDTSPLNADENRR